MSMLNDKDYWITQHVQAEKRADADRYRLVDDAQRASHEVEMDESSIWRNRRVVRAALIALVIAAILVGAQQAFAGGPDDLRPWAGGCDPESDAIKAYREGRYSLNHGEYELAVAKLTEAIDGLPEVLFQMPGYADWYWFLGEAQEGAGLYQEALVSYQQFLDLMGEWASPVTFEKVEALESQINAMLMADMQA